MNCPNCGNVMEKGFMHTQKYPFWTQQELRFFKSPTDLVELGPLDDDDTSVFTRDPFPEFPDADDTTSMFTRDPFPEFPDTMICRDCQLVVFRCNMIDKSKK